MSTKLWCRNITGIALIALTGGACDILGLGDCEADERPRDQSARISIQQGVWGHVWLWEGDFMPGNVCNSGRVTAVSRWILVYHITPDTLAEPFDHGGFFTRVHTELVDSIRSDSNGFYEMNLPSGTYSFFVRIDSLLYANEWQGVAPGAILQPATVTGGEVVKRQLDLTYNMTS